MSVPLLSLAVRKNRNQDDHCLDDGLIVGRNAQDVQSVVQNRDDEDADEGAPDAAAAAVHAGAAQRNGSDGIQLISVAQGGLCGIQSGQKNQSRQSCHAAGNRISAELGAVDVQTSLDNISYEISDASLHPIS